MKKSLFIVFCSILSLFVLVIVCNSFSLKETTNPAAGESSSFVWVYAKNCSECIRSKQAIANYMTEHPGKLVNVEVSSRGYHPLLEVYSITKVPALIVLNNGKVTAKKEGSMAVIDYLK